MEMAGFYSCFNKDGEEESMNSRFLCLKRRMGALLKVTEKIIQEDEREKIILDEINIRP